MVTTITTATMFVKLMKTPLLVLMPTQLATMKPQAVQEKLAVFAVRLDTFPLEKETAVFYIGTNQTSVLSDIRRHMLVNFEVLPISGEYIHRDAFDIAAKYGKDIFWVIKSLVHIGYQNSFP